MKSRRNVRRNRKSRRNKRGGGFFGEKTPEENKKNCLAYWDNNRSERDRLCYDEKHLQNRMYPGFLKRMRGIDTGSQVGTSTVGEMFNSDN